MRRHLSMLAVVALFITSCGLKVPVTVTAGAPGSGAGQGGTLVGPGGATNVPGATNGGPGTTGNTGTAGPNGPAVPGSGVGLFDRETEGVTKDSITLCTHVPISGAAPIPHDDERFGQFYFNYVNSELGGVYGRKVTFKAIDDRYNPTGARQAMDQCARSGAFMYLGAAGTDQIVSVANWAERKKVPYIHGPTSDIDLKGLKYNVFAGPTYEHQHRMLARYLVKRFGKTAKYQTIKVDSQYFDAGANEFRAELKKLGVSLPPDIKVQKDERINFSSTYFTLQERGITVINNFTTPNIWINMLTQKPPSYNPHWTAVSPVAGFNIVAQALSSARAKAVVFHSFGPACECATYDDAEMAEHKDLPWYSDIKEFLRIFKRYSPQQDPPPDDFDYASYLTAKSMHRLLLKVGPQPTRSKLWSLFTTYKEDPAKTFPGCAGDFTRNDLRMGAWRVNLFELVQSDKSATRGAYVWKQIKSCTDTV